ncbi:hypothetical protein ACWGB8_06210 [Kitasatospora sp. NPDC054939]
MAGAAVVPQEALDGAELGAVTAQQVEGMFVVLLLLLLAAALVLLEPWNGKRR